MDPMGRLLAPVLALLAAPAAFAEGPVGPAPGPSSPEEEMAQLTIRISKALKQNEEALTRIARGEQGKAAPVDIRIPPGQEGGSEGKAPSEQPKGGEPSEGGDPREALRKSAEQGQAISSSLDELLRLAGQMGGGGGGGGRESSPQESDGEGKKDPKKPDQGDPESGEKSKQPPEETKGKRPPTSEKDPPKTEDPREYFFAKLPDKVKEAILNGDFDQVPEKYRDLVAEWTKALGEKDRKETESPADRR